MIPNILSFIYTVKMFSTYYFISIVVILFQIIDQCLSQRGQLQQYNPCPTNILTAERTINGPPGKRNTWSGIIHLNKIAHEPNADIVLLLDNPGKIKLKDKLGEVTSVDGGFKISYSDVPSTVEFSISANPNSPFPGPSGLYLNGQDICHSSGNTGEIFSTNKPFISTDDFGEKFNPQSNTQHCGRRQIKHQGLITNGYPSQEGEWPWHAALYHRKDHTSVKYACGGSLIAANVVLTAGHCVIEGGHFIVPDRLLIKLGQHNLLLGSKNTEDFQVYNVVAHEQFDFTTFKHDIAILKLSTSVVFNYYIQPVCLWPKQQVGIENVLNRLGIVVGWGLNENDQLTDILTQGRMPVVDFNTCLESNRDFFGSFLSSDNYCAGYRNGTSVCNGDSGGGMVFKDDTGDQSTYYLRGIVSIAVAKDTENVCNPRQFVIFTDVAKYLDWIQQKL